MQGKKNHVNILKKKEQRQINPKGEITEKKKKHFHFILFLALGQGYK